jgi:hypothetical protein
MDRRPRRPINTELQALEQDLAALTLRVAALRRQVNPNPSPTSNQRLPTIGDRLRFHLAGRDSAEGVIIGITAHRVRIRQDSTRHVFLRAPHNITIITSNA